MAALARLGHVGQSSDTYRQDLLMLTAHTVTRLTSSRYQATKILDDT